MANFVVIYTNVGSIEALFSLAGDFSLEYIKFSATQSIYLKVIINNQSSRMKGVISNIQRFSVHDGPGIRVTVFMQGCPLSCWWCHNPESIPFCNVEDNDDKVRMSTKELLKEIKKDLIFMDESEGGVTFSGGEPLMQLHFLQEMLELCKVEGIHTAIDTTGFISKDAFANITDLADLFLYDLKLIDNKEHKKYTGNSNVMILENLRTLAKLNKNVIIRFPLIPGITDKKDNLIAIRGFIQELAGIDQINILPYHRIAGAKYKKLNLENKMKTVMPYSQTQINEIEKFFIDAGFSTRIGG